MGTHLSLHFARYVSGALNEMPRHQHIENGNDAQREDVEDAEATYEHGFWIVRAKLLREWVTSLREQTTGNTNITR